MPNTTEADRVGMGWRPELAEGIISSLDRIDILEVLAGGYLDATAKHGELKLLARHVPVHIHGTDPGMAGSETTCKKQLDRLARLINEVQPEAWSEHLAFVRSAGHEIGHLALPPRNEASVANTERNLRTAMKIIGSLPHMENIATLIDPPCSAFTEQSWLAQISGASGCGLLLDLHNLHANATNFGYDPLQFLDELPLERVRYIHIAGGKWIKSPDGEKQYLLDDHLHAVDEPVYVLLAEVAFRAAQPLTVILERDGAYPELPALLYEIDCARAALRAGRVRRKQEAASLHHRACKMALGFQSQDLENPAATRLEPHALNAASNVERFLALLYVDDTLRERFLLSPHETAQQHGLSSSECVSVAAISPQDLRTASHSFAQKRHSKTKHKRSRERSSLLHWLHA